MIEDRLAARLGWAIPAVTITLSTIVHILSGNNRAFPFFISETDHPGLERWIFTIGLSVTGLVLCWTSWRLYQVRKETARKLWIFAALVCGVWVGGNLTAMSFLDMYDHLELHVVTALNVFHFGLAWGVITHIAISDGNRFGKKLRYASISLSFIAFAVMSWSMGEAFIENPEALNSLDTMSEVQHWIDYAAPAEYLLAIGFFLTLASFEFDIESPSEQEE